MMERDYYSEGFVDGYKFGREEAIDEYKDAVIAEIFEAINRGEENVGLRKFLDYVAEKLKENCNGSDRKSNQES